VSKPLSKRTNGGKPRRQGVNRHRTDRQTAAESPHHWDYLFAPRRAQALPSSNHLSQRAGDLVQPVHWMGKSVASLPGEDDPNKLATMAKAYLGGGQIELGRRCYQRLSELLPHSANIHLSLGTALEFQGDWSAAAASYQRALALQPHSPDIYASLGRLQSKQGAWAEAADSCRHALALDPCRHEIYNLLGYALINGGDFASAVDAYGRALRLKPDSAYSIYGLGYLFERQGDLDSAAESYRLALKLDPQLPDAHLHLGITYFLQGNLESAAGCFERVRELAPDRSEAQTFLGHIHLLEGRFVPGWNEHEYRWRTPHFLRNRRPFPQPQWKGEPLNGSRILLHAEQGLGDTLQFVRYVPLVAGRGGDVVLEVQARLHRLLGSVQGAGKVISKGEALPEVDWQCPLLSLPLAFATDLQSIPARIPYVHPDPGLAELWRNRLARNTLRVGLVWAGSPSFAHERWRTVPLDLLAPLTRVEGTTFYSLQMGATANQVQELGADGRIIDLQSMQEDFADTAAIVANLGLVISIDTSVAHLAGAMGKPVWVLLHKSPDWRWLLDREDSPWYPTARLFRQSRLGDWRDVVVRVSEELRALVERETLALGNRDI